jgi:ankyrin repeat protein
MEKAHVWHKIREEAKEEKAEKPRKETEERQRHEMGDLLNQKMADLYALKKTAPVVSEEVRIKEMIDLINEGADLNSNISGVSTIDRALDLNNILLIKSLLDNGMRINQKNKAGKSPLSYYLAQVSLLSPTQRLVFSKHKPDIAIVQLLLDYGANVNEIDSSGQTPLMYAALDGETEIVKLMIEEKANIPSLKRLQKEPTYFSLMPHELLNEVFQYIRAIPNIKRFDGKTAIDLVRECLKRVSDDPYQHFHIISPYYKNVSQLVKRYKEVINILEPITAKR